jgi:acetyl esterase/lipase
MSVQLSILNTVLKTFVKPTLSSISTENIRQKRKFLKRISAMMPVSKDFHFEPLFFSHFKGEKIIHNDVDKSHDKIVLYFPGGAYIAGSHFSHRSITTRISQFAHAKVVAIDYRKAPEYPYPYPVLDAIHTYECILSQGYLPENISFAGDSAGGNLVLSTLFHLKEKNLPMPSSAVCMSPWTDMSGGGKSIVTKAKEDPMLPASRLGKISEMYANGLDLKDPRISPLFSDTTGFPPVLFHVGNKEIILSDSINMHQAILSNGGVADIKIWNNAPHVFQLFAGFVPQSTESLQEISQFMLKNWSFNLQTRKIPDIVTSTPSEILTG